MVFFQIVLLLGYGYALFLNRLKMSTQLIIHCLIVIIATFSLTFSFPFPLLPQGGEVAPSSLPPGIQLLKLLAISIGFPYFLLSTSSIVLQQWFYARFPTRSPYHLYALSNASSLLAVGTYPFLIEPTNTIPQQALLWLELFLLYGCSITILGLILFYLKTPSSPKSTQSISPSLPYGRWLVLSATGSLLLLAVTATLTQSIAPVPFLWLLPLLLYLFSFVLAFSERGKRFRFAYPVLFLLSTPLCLIVTTTISLPFVFTIIFFSVLLFSAFMLCHGMLYDYKPPPAYLDRFYFTSACGGAIGGTLVGIVAPLVFKDIWEFPLVLVVTACIAVFSLIKYAPQPLQNSLSRVFSSPQEILLFSYSALAIATLAALWFFARPSQDSITLVSQRNFYGVISVIAHQSPSGQLRSFAHGKVIHGSQFQSPSLRRLATTYYAPESGIGQLLHLEQTQTRPQRIGVLGLGTGTLATYGRRGDQYHFYEINPQVVSLARQYFTYLSDSSGEITITTADGRLGLANEEQHHELGYNLLILDAFSDDAIPVHLLTKEAFALYLNRLQPHGIIAVNISNTYLDLTPVIHNLATYYQLHELYILSQASTAGASTAYWALLAKDNPLLTHPSLQRIASPAGITSAIPLWTDTYSNVFQVMR